MNPLDAEPDSSSRALVDFLQGRRSSADGPRVAVLSADPNRLTPGLRTIGNARVALHMDEPGEWNVEIEQGRVGIFGARSRTTIYGEPDLLQGVLNGSGSGGEA